MSAAATVVAVLLTLLVLGAVGWYCLWKRRQAGGGEAGGEGGLRSPATPQNESIVLNQMYDPQHPPQKRPPTDERTTAAPRPLYHVQGSAQTAPNVTSGGGGDGSTTSLAANRGVQRYPNPLYQAGGASASNNHYDMGVPLPGDYGGGGAEYATVGESVAVAAAADADDDPRCSGYEAPDESAHGESPYDVAVHAGGNIVSNDRYGNQSGVYNHLAPGKRAHDTGTRVSSADGHATVTDQTYAVVGEGDNFC
jgi:hypothetical protein